MMNVAHLPSQQLFTWKTPKIVSSVVFSEESRTYGGFPSKRHVFFTPDTSSHQ